MAERKNQHLLEVAQALPFTNQVSKYIWGEAVLTATYLINRMPHKILNFETPFDVFHKFFPMNRLSSSLPLKIFECIAFVHIHSHNRGKLEPHTTKCVFVRYALTQKGYKCFEPISKKMVVTMDIYFLHFRKGNQNIDSFFYDFFQTKDLQNDPSPTLIIQPDNPIFIIPRESGLSVLDTENTSLPTMPSHDVHDPITSNKGEIRKTTAALIPFDIVYSQQRTTQMKGSSNPLHYLESMNPPSNVLINSLPHESTSLEHESCSNSEVDDSNLPISIRKGVRSCTQHPLSEYVSYKNLSLVFRAFTSQLSCMEIPNTV